MPQQTDVGRILAAIGGGLSTFAGAETASRERKAKADAGQILTPLQKLRQSVISGETPIDDPIAQLFFGKKEQTLTPLQGLRQSVISGETPIDDLKAQFLLGPKEKQLSPLQGLRQDVISGKIAPDDPMAQLLLNLGKTKEEDPNIKEARRANLENKAEARAAKKIKQKFVHNLNWFFQKINHTMGGLLILL